MGSGVERAVPGHNDLTCCGMDMIYQEVFGVRRYVCAYRAHHPAIYVNQVTGEHVSDEDLPWVGSREDANQETCDVR